MKQAGLDRSGGWLRRAAAWSLSVVIVAVVALFTLLIDASKMFQEEETVTVRSVDMTLPPPPEPPPPIRAQTADSEVQPTIDLVGPGTGPSMSFSDNPKLALTDVQQVPRPDLSLDGIDLSKALSVNFPVLEVKELDQIPRLVSTNRIGFPRELRSKGIKRVETKVEIIIDQTGKAFVKKIVDPVYPEMVDVIRKAINDSKFTIPKKNGQPVQAVYLYTLVFINRF